MRYSIILVDDTPAPPPIALEGNNFLDLVNSLSFFARTHTIAWVGNQYPLFVFTLVRHHEPVTARSYPTS